jgi:hypothetical protein
MAHKHKPGHTTHTAGHVTQQTFYASSIRCSYHLVAGCMTSHLISISSKQRHNVTASYGKTKKMSCPSCQCHHINIIPAHQDLVFKQHCSKDMTVSIYVLPHKLYSNPQFDQKTHKYYKGSVLPLIMAINNSIYYLLNCTLNHAYDVNHVINRLLLMLQRYITRHNDFKHRWITLLLSGLLSSQHISLCFLNVLYLNLRTVTWKSFWLQRTIYIMNMTIVKLVKSSFSCLHIICFWIFNKIITLRLSSKPLLSDQNLKSTTSFIGGGRPARTDYIFLKPYILSTEVQLKNPDEFSYVYSGHCSLNNAMQKIQTSEKLYLYVIYRSSWLQIF